MSKPLRPALICDQKIFNMVKMLCFGFLLICCHFSGFAQSSGQNRVAINTINTALQNVQSDTARLRLLHAKGNFYMIAFGQNRMAVKNLDSAYMAYNKAKNLGAKLRIDSTFGRYPSVLELGEVMMRKGDTTQGMRMIHEVISFYHHNGNQNREAEALHLLYKCLAQIDRARAIKGFEQVLNLRRKLGQNDLAINAGYNIVVLVFGTGDIVKADNICSALITEFKSKKNTKLDMLYIHSAMICRYRGNLDKALERTLDGMHWINKTQGKIAPAKASELYGELGQIYQELGQVEPSVAWYRKTIEVREKLSLDRRLILRTAGFMIQGLIKLGRTKEGLHYFHGLIKRNPPANSEQEAIIAQIKAYCYDALKRYDLAEYYFKEMLRLAPADMDEELLTLSKLDVAQFYIRQKKFAQARLLIAGEVNAQKTLSINKDVYLAIFKIDSAQGHMKEAITNYQRYKSINDSIFNETKSRQIEELQIKYATEQRESDISSLKKDSLLQNEKIKQANSTRNLTLIAIGLLLIIIVLLYNSYRINQKKTKEIDLKNASLNTLLEEKDTLLAEKEWLIKEVHHRVKNNLQIVMGLLQRQSSFINNKEALDAIQNSEQRMHSIALIHQKLYQSEDFKSVNMVDYIAEMIGYLQESFGLDSQISFDKQVDDIDFDIATAVPLGLILNEAITNAIKYAFKAKPGGRIDIQLKQTGEETFCLQISDDGRGLPDDLEPAKIHSMGFNLIRGLSKQLNGKLEVENQDGLTLIINFKCQARLH